MTVPKYEYCKVLGFKGDLNRLSDHQLGTEVQRQ